MIDQKNSISVISTLTPAVRTADVTAAGVDGKGAASVTHLVHVGVGGITFDDTNKIEVIMEHSDDNSSYSVCAQADVLVDAGITVASGIVKSFVVAHGAAEVYEIGYRGGKRYSRVKLEYSGTHGTGTPTATSALLGNLAIAPALAA